MRPAPEQVHWMFATGLLALGLCVLSEALVGTTVWQRRAWRAYLWPSVAFGLGVCMWLVTALYTSSAIHMLAHSAWAQVMMLAGATHIALAAGRLRNRLWELTMPLAFVVSGAAFLIHEQRGWLDSRAAFLHHALGWTLVVGAIFPLANAVRRSAIFHVGYALTIIAIAVLLYANRDFAPIFGHLSKAAGDAGR